MSREAPESQTLVSTPLFARALPAAATWSWPACLLPLPGLPRPPTEVWRLLLSRPWLGPFVLAPSVTGRDTDSMPGSDSRPLARQGTVTAALRLNMETRVCDREEWTGEGKADSIKSQGQGDSTWSHRDSKAWYKYMSGCYDVIMTSPGLKTTHDVIKLPLQTYWASSSRDTCRHTASSPTSYPRS